MNDENDPLEISDFAKPDDYEIGQEVELMISSRTDLGYRAVINGAHYGMVYHHEIFKDLHLGQLIKGYVKKIREDGRIDLILYQAGNKDTDLIIVKIIDELNACEGFLPLTDKTPAEDIYALFGVSKKKYKMAIGGLYKKHMILIEENGIRLNPQPTNTSPKKPGPEKMNSKKQNFRK